MKKLELVIFKLELLLYIRIYLVFYISLLELATRNAKQEPIYIDEEI